MLNARLPVPIAETLRRAVATAEASTFRQYQLQLWRRTARNERSYQC